MSADVGRGEMNVLSHEVSHSFHITTLVIFLLAIFHTLFANYFTMWSERIQKKYSAKSKELPVSFFIEILHFFGEIEVIFGLWVIPLMITITSFYGWKTAVDYLDSRTYIEPMFVVVIMSVTATKPIIQVAERGLSFLASRFGGGVRAWWISILTLGPILGSFITEAGAMTLCSLLLARHFFTYAPAKKLAYGTLGLLFVNISMGGLLTNFAAPPILVIRRIWDWSSLYMLNHFGIKSIVGIVLTGLIYFFLFRKDFERMEKSRRKSGNNEDGDESKPVPAWIVVTHLLFLGWIVFNSHYPPVFIGAFLLFLAFHQATLQHQFPVQLKRPLLVGLFLAGLFIHGGLQEWWIAHILKNPETKPMMFITMVLTMFNDNAAVIYLSSLLPTLTPEVKYAIMSGAVVGGGLTVIANAPNPAGLVILKKFFGGKVSPLYLFVAAFLPTMIFYLIFRFFPNPVF